MARKEVLNEGGVEFQPRIPPQRSAAPLFAAVVAALTALSLFPLWSSRLLPMQDYPQHLLLAQIAAGFQEPGLGWGEWYRVDLGFAPYMLWYLATTMLIPAVGAEAAGKLLMSLYILLVSLLACAARRLCPEGHLPWGALLLYPFAFNQMFFLGFASYLISLPIIFLALLDLERLSNGWSPATLARHALCLALLFLSHPYSVLVYLALAFVSVWVRENRPGEALRLLAPGATVAALLFIWLFTTGKGAVATAGAIPQTTWWPVGGSMAFYLLPFTGMRWTNGPDWPVLFLWLVAALPLVVPWLRSERDPVRRRLAALYGISLAGFLTLPFWLGYYSYFNLRLAPVSYFALALLISRLAVSVARGVILSGAVAAILLNSISTQQQLAAEAETVLAIAGKVERNSLVLPLVFDAAPQAVDASFFYQMHVHESQYCNLFSGSGANPTLFPNPMMPVQYRPQVRLPYPSRPQDFTWSKHGVYYDYIVTRGAPKELHSHLAPNCRLVATSGPWTLFRNLSARKPLQVVTHPPL